MNRYLSKLIMNACITRETYVFTVFRQVFHSTLKLELCRHACRRRDPIISTCRYGKNMPTTALHVTQYDSGLLLKLVALGSPKKWGICLRKSNTCTTKHVPPTNDHDDPRDWKNFKVFWSSGRPLLCFSRFWPSENVARIHRVYFAYSRTTECAHAKHCVKRKG